MRRGNIRYSKDKSNDDLIWAQTPENCVLEKIINFSRKNHFDEVGGLIM